MREEDIRWMPKVELHCHLDGSVPVQTIRKLAGLRGIPVPESDEELGRLAVAPQGCATLKEYLDRFALPLALLQSEEELYTAAYDLIGEAAKENVMYIEVRFAPLSFTKEGLTAEVALQSILRGLEAGYRDFGVHSAAILCAMRHLGEEQYSPILDLAERYGDRGVAAIDLAGDEEAYPLMPHRGMFDAARRKGIRYTIHAGECGSVQSVRDALTLKARRIGHGIAIQDDAEVLAWCAKKRIGIEMCPTSNMHTKATAGWRDYPFPLFYRSGILLTINTDNRTVSNTSLTGEFLALEEHYGITMEDVRQLTRNAIEVSFAPDNVKAALDEKLNAFTAQCTT